MIAFLLIVSFIAVPVAVASEVMSDTNTEVLVREHPQGGKPYVVIVSKDAPQARNPLQVARHTYSRPDYRMLDHKIKSGEIVYDGPVSSSKRVYIFAATLATGGVLAGTLAPIAAPVVAGGAATGGGGALVAGSAVVTGGTAAAAWWKTRPDPNRDNFTHESESRILEVSTKIDESNP